MKIRSSLRVTLCSILFPLATSAATFTLHYGSLVGFCADQTDTYTWTVYATAAGLVPDGIYCITDESESGCIGYVHVSGGQVTDLNDVYR